MISGIVGYLLAVAVAAPGPDKKEEKDQDRIRIVTLGDSITRGFRAGVKKEQTFSAVLEAQLKEKGIKAEVVNAGIGGERTEQALVRLQNDVIARKPAVVTIMYGTNDSYVDKGKKEPRITKEQYRDNLLKIVAKLKKAGIRPVLMTEPRWADKAANGAGADPNVRLEDYLKACREVARETKTPLVDNYVHWSKARKEGTDIGAWTTDLCHPNPAGHRQIAATMLPVILKELGKVGSRQ